MATLALPEIPVCFPARLKASDSIDDDEEWRDDGIWAAPEDRVTYREEPFPFEFARDSVLPPGGNAATIASIPYAAYTDGELANPQHELLCLHHKLVTSHLPNKMFERIIQVNLL